MGFHAVKCPSVGPSTSLLALTASPHIDLIPPLIPVAPKLKAHAFVTPGLHKIHIVIADINDAQLDSAIFLKSGSLRSITPQP
jgi:hypothetical protein